MTSKTVSVERVIENVYRDFPFEDSIEFEQVLEWVGIAIGLLGAPGLHKKDVCSITIDDYKGQLPDGIVNITAVRYKGTNGTRAMRYEGDPFIIKRYCDSQNSVVNLCKCSGDLTYLLNNNYMFTSFEEGTVEIAFDRVLIDDNGWPLIPDDEGVIQAMTHFVAFKVAQKLWMLDQLSKDKFQYIRQQKDWYMGKALSRSKMLSIDQMESFKNMTVRLIPKLNAHADHFSGIRAQEQRINHNNNPLQGDRSTP